MNPRILAIALVLAPLALAQDSVRSAVIAAQRQIQNRQFGEARALLTNLDAQCAAAGNPDSCRPLLDYSLGYLSQQEAAAASGEQQAALLSRARQRYASVVASQPRNGAALNSLALVEQSILAISAPGTVRDSLLKDIVAHWTQAIGSEDRNAPQYSLALGGFLASQNRLAEAMAQFQQAAEQLPDDETPRRRILEISGSLSAADHANFCAGWEPRFPGLASECYERLIGRLHAQGQNQAQPQTENALLRWTALLSSQDALTLERLKVIPPGWLPAAVSELRTYMEKPERNAGVWRWWFARPDRMSVSAEVSTTMGRQALSDPKSGPQIAAACWQGMLDARPNLAEEVGEYERVGQPVPGRGLAGVLRLYQELASLYYRNPQLDPGGARLNRMVQELFEGKGQFILQQNWKATQPFHTVLAQIFLQRGILDRGPLGAEYQLRATLDDAERRWNDPRERFFQPLPEIKRLLAETYVKLARTQDAVRMYTEAAKAYLDTDALDDARGTLDAAVRAAGTEPPVVAQLRQILQARRAPARLADLDLKQTPSLFAQSRTLPEDFLARQRFKLLADAGGAAPDAQLDSALRTYQLVTTARPVLVGTADAVRWQRAESRLLASVNAPVARQSAFAAAGPAQASEIRLTIEGENRPLRIPLASDTPLAAKVVTTLGASDLLAVRPFLKLQKGQIVVAEVPGQAATVDRAVTRMRGVMGPDMLRVSPDAVRAK